LRAEQVNAYSRQTHDFSDGGYEIAMLFPNTHQDENELSFMFRNLSRSAFTYRPKRVCLDVVPPENAEGFRYFLQDYNVESQHASPVVRFPRIPLTPGPNTLHLWVMPFSETALAFGLTEEVAINEPRTIKFAGCDVALTRTSSSVEAKITGGDPETRRTLLVDLLVTEGGSQRRVTDQRIVRRFHLDGSEITHEFQLSGELPNQRLEIGLSELEKTFSEKYRLTFPYDAPRK
jgi:hypothetical protein